MPRSTPRAFHAQVGIFHRFLVALHTTGTEWSMCIPAFLRMQTQEGVLTLLVRMQVLMWYWYTYLLPKRSIFKPPFNSIVVHSRSAAGFEVTHLRSTGILGLDVWGIVLQLFSDGEKRSNTMTATFKVESNNAALNAMAKRGRFIYTPPPATSPTSPGMLSKLSPGTIGVSSLWTPSTGRH